MSTDLRLKRLFSRDRCRKKHMDATISRSNNIEAMPYLQKMKHTETDSDQGSCDEISLLIERVEPVAKLGGDSACGPDSCDPKQDNLTNDAPNDNWKVPRPILHDRAHCVMQCNGNKTTRDRSKCHDYVLIRERLAATRQMDSQGDGDAPDEIGHGSSCRSSATSNGLTSLQV